MSSAYITANIQLILTAGTATISIKNANKKWINEIRQSYRSSQTEIVLKDASSGANYGITVENEIGKKLTVPKLLLLLL